MTDPLKLRAWLCLKNAPGLKNRELIRLLERWPDPRDFVGNSGHPLYFENGWSDQTLRHLADGVALPNLTQITKLMELHDIELLCYTDADYPLPLKEIFSPPLILYYRGDLTGALKHKCLGVVGTRKPTAYGREMCAKTIIPACRQDVTIVSGLALGIDTVAHLTALEQHSKTIAVLAAGVDSVYPPQNRELARRISNQGALMSGYEPGSKLEKWNFPARNRIISALSQAVYVVEGPLSSGALLTAKFAIEQDRELMALPGEISHPNAQGPNYLIKSGARLISCPEDVLEALGIDADPDQQLQILPELSDSEQSVWDIFQSEQRELSFDDLIIMTGLSFGKLSIILLNLELKGCIGKASGNSFVPR